MASLTTLQTWLTEAETALHKLSTGSQTVEVKKPDGATVKFTSATTHDLRAYIADLKAQIAVLTNKVSRRAIRPVF